MTIPEKEKKSTEKNNKIIKKSNSERFVISAVSASTASSRPNYKNLKTVSKKKKKRNEKKT